MPPIPLKGAWSRQRRLHHLGVSHLVLGWVAVALSVAGAIIQLAGWLDLGEGVDLIGVVVLWTVAMPLAVFYPLGFLPATPIPWLALALPLAGVAGVLAGNRLRRGHPRARRPALASSLLQLVNVPFGTVVGVMTLWALVTRGGSGDGPTTFEVVGRSGRA